MPKVNNHHHQSKAGKGLAWTLLPTRGTEGKCTHQKVFKSLILKGIETKPQRVTTSLPLGDASYIHTHAYIYMHTCTHIYTYTSMDTYTTHLCTQHMYIYINTHTCMCTGVHHIHVYIHICTICKNTWIYTHMYAYTHTY